MKSIKCDKCIYLGRRYEKGVIMIQSGAFPINEPYATCLKRQYFVLEREVIKCQDYKEVQDKISSKKSEIPFKFTTEDIIGIFKTQEWITLDDVVSRLHLTEKTQIRYLPLKIKALVRKELLMMKLGSKKLIYALKS